MDVRFGKNVCLAALRAGWLVLGIDASIGTPSHLNHSLLASWDMCVIFTINGCSCQVAWAFQ